MRKKRMNEAVPARIFYFYALTVGKQFLFRFFFFLNSQVSLFSFLFCATYLKS